jgi:hypothetical protein
MLPRPCRHVDRFGPRTRVCALFAPARRLLACINRALPVDQARVQVVLPVGSCSPPEQPFPTPLFTTVCWWIQPAACSMASPRASFPSLPLPTITSVAPGPANIPIATARKTGKNMAGYVFSCYNSRLRITGKASAIDPQSLRCGLHLAFVSCQSSARHHGLERHEPELEADRSRFLERASSIFPSEQTLESPEIVPQCATFCHAMRPLNRASALRISCRRHHIRSGPCNSACQSRRGTPRPARIPPIPPMFTISMIARDLAGIRTLTVRNC